MNKNNKEKKVFLVEFSGQNDSEIVFAFSVRELLSKIKGKNWDNFMDITAEYRNE